MRVNIRIKKRFERFTFIKCYFHLSTKHNYQYRCRRTVINQVHHIFSSKYRNFVYLIEKYFYQSVSSTMYRIAKPVTQYTYRNPVGTGDCFRHSFYPPEISENDNDEDPLRAAG